MSRGYIDTGSMYTAAELGVADIIADGPMPISAIAAAAGTDTRMLQRLLNFLVTRGVFKHTLNSESTESCYENSAISTLLRKDTPGSMRDVALLPKWECPAWTHMSASMQKGEKRAAFEMCHNKTVWQYLGENPADAKTFSGAMSGYMEMRKGLLRGLDPAVAASDGAVIVDVGGAEGAMLAFVLEELRPQARGVVFDLPHVAAGAQKFIEGRGLSSRMEAVGGSFMNAEDIPAGAQLYLLGFILHDWSDEDCCSILRALAARIADDSMILLVEFVVSEDGSQGPAITMDMVMMSNFGKSMERTRGQFATLCEAEGLSLQSVDVSPGGLGLLYVRKA